MRLNPQRYDRIQKLADKILLEYGSFQFPVDPYKIIRQLPDAELRLYSSYTEVERQFLNAVSEDGFTQLKSGKHIIWLNDSVWEERKRYTLAHEIGHIVLGHLYKPELLDEIKEAEANFFANRLLVPMWAIHGLAEIEPWHISSCFGVSMECAYYRIKNYNHWIMIGSPTTEIEEFLSMLMSFDNPYEQEVTYAS